MALTPRRDTYKSISQILLSEPLPHTGSKDDMTDYVRRVVSKLTSKLIVEDMTEGGGGDIITIYVNSTTNTYVTNNVTYFTSLLSGCIRATVTAVNATNLTCTAEGSTVTVIPLEHLGTNDLTGDVWPKLSVDDVICIFQVGGSYYTVFTFDDTYDFTPLPIEKGGTAAVTASAALSNLGVGTEDSPSFSGLTLTDDLSLGANNIFMSGSIGVTGTRVLKG